MKLLKVVLVLFILTTVALLSFGCAESFTYAFYVDNGGAVHTEFLLRYDKESPDASTVKEQAILAMENYVTAQGYNAYATLNSDVEGEVSLCIEFPSVTDYYIALGYDGKEANEPNEPTKVGFINAYEEQENSYLTETNLLAVRALVGEDYRDFPLDCDFYYTYGTTSKMTESNGSVEEKDGIYYHTWKLKYGEAADIHITKYAPNGIILFSVTISIFVLSLAVIFVIIIINRKKKKAIPAAEVAEEGGAEGDPTAE